MQIFPQHRSKVTIHLEQSLVRHFADHRVPMQASSEVHQARLGEVEAPTQIPQLHHSSIGHHWGRQHDLDAHMGGRGIQEAAFPSVVAYSCQSQLSRSSPQRVPQRPSLLAPVTACRTQYGQKTSWVLKHMSSPKILFTRISRVPFVWRPMDEHLPDRSLGTLTSDIFYQGPHCLGRHEDHALPHGNHAC
jgi:hypothetical protein